MSEKTKKQNILYSTILHKIYIGSPISRIDIARDTGITPATVTLITSEMIDNGIIKEVGYDTREEERAGRKKILLSIEPNKMFFVGSEISQNFLSFVLCDNLGNIIEKNAIPINHEKISDELFKNYLENFVRSLKNYNITSIGVAIPGHYDNKNPDEIITNNSYWDNFSLNKIKNNFSIPVHFSNNAHCMARAQLLFSPKESGDNFLFFHIGNGIHCTYIYNNELYSNNNFNVGEVGHMVVDPNGTLCECGKRGCLQTYSSDAWLIKKAQFLFDASSNTFLHNICASKDDITIESIIKGYELGDPGLIRLIDSAVKKVALTASNLQLLLDANKIIIHSKIFSNEDLGRLLLNTFNSTPNLYTRDSNSNSLIIKPYSLSSGAIGAAAMSLYNSLLLPQD